MASLKILGSVKSQAVSQIIFCCPAACCCSPFRSAAVQSVFSDWLDSLTSKDVQHSLSSDWNLARSKITAEITVKLSIWQHLPHILCALAHWDSQAHRGPKTFDVHYTGQWTGMDCTGLSLTLWLWLWLWQVVQRCAKRALLLWEKGTDSNGKPISASCKHSQSRRFLDPSWKGLGDKSEQPLRQYASCLHLHCYYCFGILFLLFCPIIMIIIIFINYNNI